MMRKCGLILAGGLCEAQAVHSWKMRGTSFKTSLEPALDLQVAAPVLPGQPARVPLLKRKTFQ